jgi:hypothetical protein
MARRGHPIEKVLDFFKNASPREAEMALALVKAEVKGKLGAGGSEGRPKGSRKHKESTAATATPSA